MKTPTPVRLHSYVLQLSDFVSLYMYMIPVFLKIKTNLEAQKGGSAALEGAGFIRLSLIDACIYMRSGYHDGALGSSSGLLN